MQFSNIENSYLPDHELVVVLSSERGQILLVSAERETLDEHLVQLKVVDRLQVVKVPDDNLGLKIAVQLVKIEYEGQRCLCLGQLLTWNPMWVF